MCEGLMKERKLVNERKVSQAIYQIDKAMYTIFRVLGPKISGELEEYEITKDQFFLLNVINNTQATTPSQLAAMFRVQPSAITAMIDRMLKHKLVFRQRDETDRRVVYIVISDKGREALEKAIKTRNKIMATYLKHFTDEELEQFIYSFDKLARLILEDME